MLQKINILITGPPGCGKSTLITHIITYLNQQNVKIGGIITPDFRSRNGRRNGFFIRDVATGKEEIMASVDLQSRIRVGRYGVDAHAIHGVGVAAIKQAIACADIIIIDEIGKMELAVPAFQNSVTAALDSKKPVLGTIGLYLKTSFATMMRNRPDVRVFSLRRDQLAVVFERVKTLLGISGGGSS